MDGEASPAQVAGFLMALRAKGETVEEMRGLADVDARACQPDRGRRAEPRHRRHRRRPRAHRQHLDDGRDGRRRRRGPGGQARQPCGVVVVGLGRRARGAGGRPDAAPERVVEVAAEAGITFCFAQTFHPSMRHAAPAASDLGIGTAFNFLGPLTNPAQPTYAAVGVRRRRGWRRSWRGSSPTGARTPRSSAATTAWTSSPSSTTSTVWWVRDGAVAGAPLDPEQARPRALHPVEALRGADAAHNAGVVRDVLAGATGPVRDAVVLNAGIALALTGRTSRTRRRADGGRTCARAMARAADGRRRPVRRTGARSNAGAWTAGDAAGLNGGSSGGRPGERSVVVEAQAEGCLEVVLGVGAEGDVGLRARARPSTLLSRSAMTSAKSSCRRTRTMAMRSASPVTE